MVAVADLQCPINGCLFIAKRKNGVSLHVRARHATLTITEIGTRKDGQVEIDLSGFPEGVIPEPEAGGFWRSILKMPATWGVVLVFGMLTYQAALTSPLNALGLAVATPVVVLLMWWVTESKNHTKVAVISNPPDPDGRVRITFQWWESHLADLLPQEARRTTGRSSIYVIDITGEKPVAFTPFTVTPPEFAIPVRGAMANQQIDNEQLNKVRRKGIRPEVVQQAFALLVIGGLIMANIAVMGQLLEFINQ